MNRGELRKVVEAVSTIGESNEYELASRIVLDLLGKVTLAANAGELWAAITFAATRDDDEQVSLLSTAMAQASQFMQEEGFQTDDAYAEADDSLYHQLKVFWGSGKDIYEHELARLGSIEPESLASARYV